MSTHATQVVPARPSLEQYKKQARELLQALQSGQIDAVERLRSSAPHLVPSGVRLADAQFVIAREHGFASWPKFKQHVEMSIATVAEKADAFVRAAIGNRLADAKRLADEVPGLTRASLATALVYGEVETVLRLLDGEPDLVSASVGPLNRQPILYVCFSRFIHERETEMLSTARLLLERGADPNAAYIDGQWALPALYGACGQLGHAGLAEILIDAGAKVDDNESLYHSVEHRDHACTRLLLERGAQIKVSNALKHQLDIEDVDGLNLLLSFGADPNDNNAQGDNALHWAIFRRRSVACITPLLDHGVDINAARTDGMTPYRLALRMGHHDAANLLHERGADTSSTPVDDVLGVAGRGDADAVRSIIAANPGLISSMSAKELGSLASFADDGNTTAVSILLDVGFPIDARGDHNATALHWAAWKGHSETVKLLIDRGAPIEIEGADLGSTPLQWAIHASANNPDVPPEAAIAVVDALMSAGAVPRTLEMASEEVRAYVEERMTA